MRTMNLSVVSLKKYIYMLYLVNNDLSQALTNFFLKDQIVNILGFAGHTIFWLVNFTSVAQKWPKDNT